MAGILKPLEMAQMFLARHIEQGDTVVDATIGNGHDAVFLAKQVGLGGLVVGFDVQQIAIDRSEQRLKEHEFTEFELHCCGHQQMMQVFEERGYERASAIMFNLGYLPSADKSIISQTQTTLQAIDQSLQLLKVNGLLSIVCYPGHSGGDQEADQVRKCLSALDRKSWRVIEYGYLNAPNSPAFLVLVEKLKDSAVEPLKDDTED